VEGAPEKLNATFSTLLPDVAARMELPLVGTISKVTVPLPEGTAFNSRSSPLVQALAAAPPIPSVQFVTDTVKPYQLKLPVGTSAFNKSGFEAHALGAAKGSRRPRVTRGRQNVMMGAKLQATSH
jgi:hypothetical protein